MSQSNGSRIDVVSYRADSGNQRIIIARDMMSLPLQWTGISN